MKVFVWLESNRLEIEVGQGHNNIRWLSLVAVLKYSSLVFPRALHVPTSVKLLTGAILNPRCRIRDALSDGAEVAVLIRNQGLNDQNEKVGDVESPRVWHDSAFGRDSQLCSTRIEWKPEKPLRDKIPEKLVGTFSILNCAFKDKYHWPEDERVIELPLVPVEDGGSKRWESTLRSPPGVFRYKVTFDESAVLAQWNSNRPELGGERIVEPDLPYFEPITYS